jgi:hypothetical protein
MNIVVKSLFLITLLVPAHLASMQAPPEEKVVLKPQPGKLTRLAKAVAFSSTAGMVSGAILAPRGMKLLTSLACGTSVAVVFPLLVLITELPSMVYQDLEKNGIDSVTGYGLLGATLGSLCIISATYPK